MDLIASNSLWLSWGWLSDLLERLSDLQQRDKMVTLNQLVGDFSWPEIRNPWKTPTKYQGTTRSTSHRFDQRLACGEVLLLLPCNGECQVTPPLHPGRLTWFTRKYTLFEKENHLNLTIIFRFYVNLSGCMHARMIWWRFNHFFLSQNH